jgi:spore germination cell wall hydrolase CwlJ-like protein
MQMAIKMLESVERFFDRNHSAFLLWGGLFSVLFLGLFVPYHSLTNMQKHYSYQIESYKIQNAQLNSTIGSMSNEIGFLRSSFEQKQSVMQQVDCLAKNIYFEAGIEPRAGKIAVAEVTMNRVRSAAFPKTVCGVVYQKTRVGSRTVCQFSWVCQGKNTPRNQRAWRESRNIAESILIAKKSYGVVGSAKFFHATYVNPEWADESRIIAQIGNHIFYR